MEHRSFVTFDADYPEDGEWDEQGNLLLPSGQFLAAELLRRLEENGAKCSILFQHSFYGWSFDAAVTKLLVWCMLQTCDTWLLIMERRQSLLGGILGQFGRADFDHFLQIVHALLTSDPKISNVRWHTKSDYNAGRFGRSSLIP